LEDASRDRQPGLNIGFTAGRIEYWLLPIEVYGVAVIFVLILWWIVAKLFHVLCFM
jgi:hypothetical protein